MLRIAVCDDEKESLHGLCQLVEEYRAQRQMQLLCIPFTGSFGLLSAMECGEHFDIALLDVVMPNLNGIQVAEEIRRLDEGMEILFVSTSSEYAVDGYSVRARNYLIKPVSREKFFRVMDQLLAERPAEISPSLWVRDKDGGICRVEYHRLIYCEVIRKDIVFYMFGGKTLSSRKSMTELLTELGEDGRFFQPHRSYLVNMDHVQRVTKTELILTDGSCVPLSRGNSAQAMDLFIRHSFQAMLSGEVKHGDGI